MNPSFTLTKRTLSIFLWFGLAVLTGCGRGFQAAQVALEDSELAAPTAAGAVNTDGPVCSVFRGATNLKYFGFFCSSCDWVGEGSYTDEVKGFANTVFVASGSHSNDFFRRELQKAKEAGMNAIVSVTNFNMGLPPGPSGDFDYWWNFHLPVIRPFVEDGTIVAFYVSDDAAPVDLFDSTFRKIKETFTKPVKLMAIVMPGVPYDSYSQQHLSGEVDWIGFETYSYATPQYFEYVKQNFLKPHQQIVLVPGVFSQRTPYPWGGNMSSIDATLAEATNNPRVVAVIPFLWSDGPGLTGARSIPEFKAKVEQVGACFSKGSETQGRINFAASARGAQARASSTYVDIGHFSAAAAIDGNRGALRWPEEGGWNSLGDPTESNPDWLEVSFGTPQPIDEIQIFTLADNYNGISNPLTTDSALSYGLLDFELQYHDGTRWITPTGGRFQNHTQVGAQVKMSPVSTSKVRVLIQRARAGWARVVELEAWGTRSTQNVASASSGATVSASSTVMVPGLDFGAGGVINGDRTGRNWEHGGGWNSAANPTAERPESVEITFAAEKSISTIRVFTLQDNYSAPHAPTREMAFTAYGIENFEVHYWNGSTWALVPGGRIGDNTRVQTEIVFNEIKTQKIRVVVTKARAGYARITEVEAIGY